MSTEIQPIVDAETVARVLLHGDLKQLTSSQKLPHAQRDGMCRVPA